MGNTLNAIVPATPPPPAVPGEPDPPPAAVVRPAVPEPAPAMRNHSISRESLDLAEIARMAAAVNRGVMPAEMLTAALTDVTTTSWPSPPAYITELVDMIVIGRPLVQAFGVKPLTATGQKLTYPTVTTPPNPNVVAGEKVQIPTGPVVLGDKELPVQTIAWGNDVSMQTIDRSDPSFLQMYFDLCAEYYAQRCDLIAYAAILAGTPAGNKVTGETGAEAITAAIAAAAGGKRAVDVLVLSQDLAILVGSQLTVQNSPLGLVPGSAWNFLPSPVIDPLLPDGTAIAGARAAYSWWENAGAPAQLRAVNVSLLGYDLGIYGYAAEGVIHPEALAIGTVAPAAPLTADAKKGS